MIDYEEALELVLGSVGTCGLERLPTVAARGQMLAEDIVARVASPPFNKAAMDGYAVRQADVTDLPAELDIVGEVFAGQHPEFSIGPGQAAVIATGAPVPEGADTVVMVEDTEQTGDRTVRVNGLSGVNICPAGEDVRAGDTVLAAGQALTAMRVGVAAAAGHAEVAVHRRPAGALLCTGSEVVEPGSDVPRGSILNANGPMLSALLIPVCRRFNYLGIAGDDEEQLTEKIHEGLQSDLLVISGGVSVGQYDLVPAVLERLGVRRVFHRVAIKPGKPVFFGTKNGCAIFGMPGNPQSCFVIFHILVAPAIAAMSGEAHLPPVFREGIAAEDFGNKPQRTNFMPCTIEHQDGVNVLRRCKYHGSGDIVGPSAADGYFLVPRGVERVRKGDRLRFFAT
ncbi:MAG: molybdopterin molybdotransferase MoeA [Planctomycetota bacterium]|jgi:molybdopterin molybdotransferase